MNQIRDYYYMQNEPRPPPAAFIPRRAKKVVTMYRLRCFSHLRSRVGPKNKKL